MDKTLPILLLTLLGFLSFSGRIGAQGKHKADLPLIPVPGMLPPLTTLEDPILQAGLTRALAARPVWKSLADAGKLAVGLVDLSDPNHIRYASVNGEEMMYAASLPKIAVLLAAEDAMEKGKLPASPAVLSDLRLMISRSDNQATTRMIDRLGYRHIEAVLTHPRYRLYDRQCGGGLWVGKRYAAGGERYPDPLQGLSHAASVSQVCRFYYLLATGRLVSPARSAHMLAMLEAPELKHKFVNTLQQTAPAARIFRKSGTWRQWHADSVLVWGEGWQRYILVGLAEDAQGEQIMRDLVRVAEETLQGRTILALQAPPGVATPSVR
ncbi:MAG: hypothetical protein RLY31_1921 [Bacteroidota bacterium]|jgi:beta-lactamase class A